MCDLYLERYIGVSCTGMYVKLEVLWEVHFPLAYTLTVTLRLKNQVLSSWLKVSEATWTKDKQRTMRPRRVSVLWPGAAWCSCLGLLLILLLKAVPIWGLSTMRANRCRCVPSTLQQTLSSWAQLRYRACILCLGFDLKLCPTNSKSFCIFRICENKWQHVLTSYKLCD